QLLRRERATLVRRTCNSRAANVQFLRGERAILAEPDQPAAALTAAAVEASAGRNASTLSSARAMSTAVPKVVTVLMKERSPAGVRIRSGTAIRPSGEGCC